MTHCYQCRWLRLLGYTTLCYKDTWDYFATCYFHAHTKELETNTVSQEANGHSEAQEIWDLES